MLCPACREIDVRQRQTDRHDVILPMRRAERQSLCDVDWDVRTRCTMSFLPSIAMFCELQLVHETGYFLPQPTLEDSWQQVTTDHL